MATHYETGKYRVRVVAQALDAGGKGKDGAVKNPSFQLGIMPIGVYDGGELQEIDADFERTIYLPLTEATLGTSEQPGWVLETLKYLGFRGESFADLDPSNEGHHSFVGDELDSICSHDTYQGKTREKWSVYRGGGLKATPLDPRSVRGLDAKFAKLLKTLQGVPSKTPAAPTPPTPPAPPAAPSKPPRKPRKSKSTAGSEQFNEHPIPGGDDADIPF